MNIRVFTALALGVSLAAASSSSDKNNAKKQGKDLESPYSKWIKEDVAYIITDEERQAWTRLAADDEREQFIEQFWLRRDPSPDTEENEFKEEHYRRIAYSNERFASGLPGWKTDRGRIYITYGPPDDIEDHSSGGTYQRPSQDGGGITSTYPFQQWRYRFIESVGTNVIIEFVDPTMSGEFRMTMDPNEKNALRNTPADAGPGTPAGGQPEGSSEFARLEQYVNVFKPPPVRFKDLQGKVDSVIKFNILPMRARADYFPLTESSILTNVTVQFENRDLQFKTEGGVEKATVNLYGRVTTMSRRVVNVFEDTVTSESSATLLADTRSRASLYQKSIPLAPGRYRLNIVARDVVGGNTNNYEMVLDTPGFDYNKLAASSLVLADRIERVSTRSAGSGPFVLGATKVRPRISAVFLADEQMGIYLKLYNFAPSKDTNKPNASIEYEILNAAHARVFNFREEAADLPGASSRQATIEKMLPLSTAELQPGSYSLKIWVVDRNSSQTVSAVAAFSVR